MRLSTYIRDLGRTIAYHPNLKIVTGSTTASILLCQFIYWMDKTKDGWIYKTHYEIEDETGLTYYEQKSAREKLVELGIMEEEFKRWDRTNRYRINVDRLNDLWEEAHGRKPEVELTKEEPLMEETKVSASPINLLQAYQDPALHPNHPAHRTDAIKKGDLVDAMVDLSKEPGVMRENAKNEIRGKLSTKLHIYIDAKKWDKFIDFVYERETTYKEPVEKFISWLMANNPNSSFWTPDKLMMQYPQAFAEDKNKPKEDFVEKPPEHKEDDSVPMPDYIKSKKKLY